MVVAASRIGPFYPKNLYHMRAVSGLARHSFSGIQSTVDHLTILHRCIGCFLDGRSDRISSRVVRGSLDGREAFSEYYVQS